MAAGIPTISTDFGTVQDFVTHQDNGFLVNEQEDWINAVLRIISDSALRERMIASARQTVEEGYSVSANKKKYINILNNLSKT